MYLGVDQSLEKTGVAVLDDGGEVLHLSVVKPKVHHGAERLASIRDQLVERIRVYQVKQAALEGYSFESVHRAFDLGEVGGLVRLVFYDLGIPFTVVAPAALKKFVSGNSQADKAKMRIATQRKWGIDTDQDDECDAYGLARVAQVFTTGSSRDRDELEVVTKLKKPAGRDTPVSRGRVRFNI